MKEVDYDFVVKNCKDYGFDEYGHKIYKYGNLFFFVNENNKTLVSTMYQTVFEAKEINS